MKKTKLCISSTRLTTLPVPHEGRHGGRVYTGMPTLGSTRHCANHLGRKPDTNLCSLWGDLNQRILVPLLVNTVQSVTEFLLKKEKQRGRGRAKDTSFFLSCELEGCIAKCTSLWANGTGLTLRMGERYRSGLSTPSTTGGTKFRAWNWRIHVYLKIQRGS